MLRWALALGVLCASVPAASGNQEVEPVPTAKVKRIPLPKPVRKGRLTLEEALLDRRSLRDFADAELTERELSQLCWAAQGVTNPREGLRTAPSAGALYPLELYLVKKDGLHHYDPAKHALSRLGEEDLRDALHRAALRQAPVREAPVVFVFAAVYKRTEGKYGKARTPRYVHMEVGHAAQNLLLEAVSLGLGGVPVGAFEDARVRRVLGLPADHQPLYLIPVGRPR